MKDIAIIGGGAAGCFCAAEIKRHNPSCNVTVFESGPRPMRKLAITGGGRCNLTNSFACVFSESDRLADGTFPSAARAKDLSPVYPRGARFMKKVFSRFDQNDCCRWFEDEGVHLVVQPDQCIFPLSQDAMQIVHVLEGAMRSLGVQVVCGQKVTAIEPDLSVRFADGSVVHPDSVVLTSGGATADILEPCDLKLVPPVPSLFTFKIADDGMRSLMGTVVDNVTLGLAGTNFRSHGTLLLTDWGVSGPATLRLSSYAARWLASEQYRANLLVNWLNDSESGVRERLAIMSKGARTVANSHPSELSDRLWRMLVERAGIRPDARWAELGNKGLSRLVNVLISDSYPIVGRARFKEEFVTCGGVSLDEVDPSSMECRRIPGLYFAGEVLDIDAVTGGFNLQAAWSTAWVAAKSIATL